MAYGCVMECIPLATEAVNTHREKPKVRPAEGIECGEYSILSPRRIPDLIERFPKR